MPNLKLYLDETHLTEQRPRLAELMPELRGLLCKSFGVEPSACQLAVVPVLALPDQPTINAELNLMPRPDRTRDAVTAKAQELQRVIADATGLRIAVRVAMLDAETYVALK
ncbi:hypothetical protein [Paracoccus laeviglucosivorans]|uniref:Tautomerase enzyme n=1 Tax=Paracoccus laeviglucosivorans TaxID=1197861 RepID=A0A521EQU6_9RHOB|nr:hypothetical protein [Paracoccus laeviglucosivorans]SMO85480.1 hypothetical protein SAMN06265221_11444 [Paracoccus laeviglucosivorans]